MIPVRRAVTGLVLLILVATAWLVAPRTVAGGAVGIGARAPEISGGPWIGSAPLTIASLLGRVALVDFWTYG